MAIGFDGEIITGRRVCCERAFFCHERKKRIETGGINKQALSADNNTMEIDDRLTDEKEFIRI